MNHTQRMEYGQSLANMFNWTQTTYLRGEYKFNSSYTDKLCNRLVSSPLIYGVFASIEKDRNEEHNHLHLLFSAEYNLSRHWLAKRMWFNSLGIGNVDIVKNKTGVSKYIAKHIGKDFSYHNLYV